MATVEVRWRGHELLVTGRFIPAGKPSFCDPNEGETDIQSIRCILNLRSRRLCDSLVEKLEGDRDFVDSIWEELLRI